MNSIKHILWCSFLLTSTFLFGCAQQENQKNSAETTNGESSLMTPPTTTGAKSSRVFRLEQKDGWRLNLTLVEQPDGSITPGKHEFSQLRCGGMFQFEKRENDGRLVLRQKITYGSCVQNCQLILAKDYGSYREVCSGRQTGEGIFAVLPNSQGRSIDTTPQTKGQPPSTGSNSKTTTTCLNASFEGYSPPPNFGTEFYGDCDSRGVAISGIIVSTYRGTPVSVNCLINSRQTSQVFSTGAFSQCERYWPLLRNFCETSDGYKGQCKDGKANGVGRRQIEKYTAPEIQAKGITGAIMQWGSIFAPKPPTEYSIFTGMFLDDALDGFGIYARVTGCGLAGCSGNKINETGWFEKGRLKIACTDVQACSKMISGTAFTKRLRHEIIASSPIAQDKSFEEYTKIFEETGNVEALRKAKQKAQSKGQKALIEFSTIRLAGYDKIFPINVIVQNGATSIELKDQSRLLGYFRTVDASRPLKVRWNIFPDQSVVKLTERYRVRIRIGIDVKKLKEACSAALCNRHEDTDSYIGEFEIMLGPETKYRGQGVRDITVSDASTVMALGVGQTQKIVDISPVVEIQTVELIK